MTTDIPSAVERITAQVPRAPHVNTPNVNAARFGVARLRSQSQELVVRLRKEGLDLLYDLVGKV